MAATDLSIPNLQRAYAEKTTTPLLVLESLYPLLAAEQACFITLAPLADIQERCRSLESLPEQERLSLFGVPFAVKDNIDAMPYPTTAACPAFAYMPAANAPAVQALLDAGGVMVGKTNMDQFAAGLVGTRTPYGNARNAFDDRFIPGGSSSGSGALVGAGLVTFALGTDTAGSGRVPAMLNGCVGIKPTVGRVSSQGVVPACRALDCISCFARTVEDGALVVKLMQKAGSLADPRWRPPPGLLPRHTSLANGSSPGPASPPQTLAHRAEQTAGAFKFGVPGPQFLEFLGPGGQSVAKAYEDAFEAAIQRMAGIGGECVPVDFSAFCEIAMLLYNSAFVAERYSGIRAFVESSVAGGSVTKELVESDSRMELVTAAIIARGTLYSAADVYQANDHLSDLGSKARMELAKVDLLLVPTALQNYLVVEIEAEEKCRQPPTWDKNTLLGRFTNFVNLLDMAAVSVPSTLIHCMERTAELRAAGTSGLEDETARRVRILQETGNSTPVLPVGVTLIGPAWTDEFLWEIAAEMHAQCGLKCGPAGHNVKAYRQPSRVATPAKKNARSCQTLQPSE